MNTFYTGKPILLDAKVAHAKKYIVYDSKGVVKLNYKGLKQTIPLNKQFPMVFAAFMDLNKSLSNLANSPRVGKNRSLREDFDEEFNYYRGLVAEAQKKGTIEPDYGTYFYDVITGNLYILPPEKWHRLGLVTNTAKLMTSAGDKLSWLDIRKIFDNAVIGFAGISVGGNILEGWLREARPKTVKIADHDWQEITNLNRLERGSLRYMVRSRADHKDPRNPFEIHRISKAELAAYEQQLIDPYSTWHIYPDGLNEDNIERFIMGDKNEPPIDIFVEEIDNIPMKIKIRQICRKHRIPVLMLSDFGHRVLVQFQDYRKNPKLGLGYNVSDEEVLLRLDKLVSGGGNRKDLFKLVGALCGKDFAKDEFKSWVEGKGEQPTSSLPQSGATAQAAGGIGGKVLAWYLLGYKIPERLIWDFHKSTSSSIGRAE